MYGAVLTVEGEKCFVGVRVDPDKKKDRADRSLLEAAARDIGALPEYGKAREQSGETNARSKSRRR
jgi:hypothetical protein